MDACMQSDGNFTLELTKFSGQWLSLDIHWPYVILPFTENLE